MSKPIYHITVALDENGYRPTKKELSDIKRAFMKAHKKAGNDVVIIVTDSRVVVQADIRE